MKKRILLVYATYGTGHKTIAKYVETYFKEKNENIEILSIDLLLYSLPILGSFSQKVSNKMILSKNPIVWSCVYNLYNNKFSVKTSNKIIINLFNNKKLKKMIMDYNPDLTISTHFWASSLIASFNKKHYIDSKLITIVTDYKAHEFWMNNYKSEDAIIVSGKEIKNYLIEKNIPKEKIMTYGIPISSNFSQKLTITQKNNLIKSMNLDRDKMTFLFFGGGGLGSSACLPYFEALLRLNLDINIIFVSGMSKELKSEAQELVKYYKTKNIKVLGFVTNVPSLLQISCAVITKPGGVTVTECMCENKPMILIGKKGGNELGNARYIEKHNFGISVGKTKDFSRVMEKLVKYPNVIKKFESKLIKHDINKNDSIDKLYNLSIELLKM